MPDQNSVMDLVDVIGFEAVDEEITVWIETGAYDHEVIRRALHLGMKNAPYGVAEPDDRPLF